MQFSRAIAIFLIGPCQVDGEWVTEIVRDSAVINAYLRRRQILEDEAQQADTLAPTGDADKDRRYKKRCVSLSLSWVTCPWRTVFADTRQGSRRSLHG